MGSHQEMQGSLYEYELMTSGQLAILHGYKKSTVVPMLSRMFKKSEIRKVNVAEIARHAKAYYLAPSSAKFIAESRNEAHLFKEKDWESVPGSLLNIILTNQFFCELIRISKGVPDTGLVQWIGRRSIMYRFMQHEDKKHPKMNGYAVFQYKQNKYSIYLNVLTGNESVTVIQEMVSEHYRMIKTERRNDASSAILLFLCLGENNVKKVLTIWNKSIGEDKKAPFVAAANFESLATGGILSPVWKNKEFVNLSLLDMPYKKNQDTVKESHFLGKRQIISLKFNRLANFEEPENELLADEKSKPGKADNLLEKKENQEEAAGIVWEV